jgi:hypothetical protein
MISGFFYQVNKLYSRCRVNVYKSIETRKASWPAYHSRSFFLSELSIDRETDDMLSLKEKQGYLKDIPADITA